MRKREREREKEREKERAREGVRVRGSLIHTHTHSVTLLKHRHMHLLNTFVTFRPDQFELRIDDAVSERALPRPAHASSLDRCYALE